MAKSKIESKDKDYLESVSLLFGIFVRLGKSEDNWRDFLKDILTSSELRMVKKRWQIANLLSAGKSVRQAATIAGVGTDTVIRISKKINEGSGGLKKALQRSQVQLPNKNKISAGTYLAREKKSSRWVFGSSKS